MPGTQPIRILVGGPVKKSAPIVREYLASLKRQILPPNVTLSYCFCDDNDDKESSAQLTAFVEENGGAVFTAGGQDATYSDSNHLTHQWTGSSMERVGHIKNEIIRHALEHSFDYLWLVDADLVLAPRVLWSLYHASAPIVCGVFWTKWLNVPGMEDLPQVWLRHPYGLDGRGRDRARFIAELRELQRVQVWGQGACSLYQTAVLNKGVNFSYLPDLPKEGMWQGEDRHLCVRAERLHVPMFADAWPLIWHCYHPQQVNEVAAAGQYLADEAPGKPGLDHYVSCIVQPLEPVQVPGGVLQIQPQHIRGQLGRLRLAPELEQAIGGLGRGEKQIVSVEFPSWSPVEPYRGKRRLLEVTLVDWRKGAQNV